MKTNFKIVFFSLFLILVGCGKSNEAPKELKTIEAPIVSIPKETAVISEDDAKLLKHYGACGTILKASIQLANQNGLKDIVSSYAHEATIYDVVGDQIMEKYPKSLQESGIKISNEFLTDNIIGKAVNGKQLVEFRKQNGDCSLLNDFSRDKIDEIMNIEKDRYDRIYKKLVML
jgi:hypothetical protein